MLILDAIYSALSGIRSSLTRHAVSAHNVANLNTDGFQPQRVAQVELPQGGADTRVFSTPELLQPPPPDMDFPEAYNLSAVDLVEEMVNQIQALRSLQANLNTIHASDEIVNSLLEN